MLVAFFLIILFCFPVFAQTTPVVSIDAVTVDARSEDKNQTTAPSTIVDLPTTSPQTTTAADIVSRTSGVHVQRYGGLEDATGVSIRGSTADQVQVFLDGVPLETASGEGFNLNQIPATSLSSVKIYKGLAPLEAGGSSTGGVIQLQTPRISDGIHQRYGFSYGSFSTLDALAEFSKGGERHDVLIGIDFKRTEGDFTFLDDNGTPLNSADDQEATRINNDDLSLHPRLNWTHRFDGLTTLTVNQHFFYDKSGVPGLGTFQSDSARLQQMEWLSQLSLKRTGVFDGHAIVTNNLYWRVIGSQFEDPFGEIGLGAAQDNNNKTFIAGDKLIFDTVFSKIFSLKNGLELLSESFAPHDDLAVDPDGATSKRYQINVSAEPTLTLFDEKLNWSFFVSSLNAFYNINNDDPDQLNAGTYFSDRNEFGWTAGTALNYELKSGWHLKSSVSRVVRLPKFMEMFGDQGNVLGNPQLTSENGIKFDVGTTWSKAFEGFFKKLICEANYFTAHMNDLIQFEVTSGRARASNIGETRVSGVELVFDTRFAQYFELATNYTYQRPIDESTYPGNFLIGRPEHEVGVDLSFEHKGFSVGTLLQYVDNQYLDALNTQRVDERLLVNARVAYLWKEKYRLGLEVKNLTDSQIVDALGYPLPGRSVFVRGDLIF